MPRKKYNYYNRGIPTPKYETGPNCDGCPFRDYTQGFVPGSGSLSSKYMVIAENPAYEEIKKGLGLVGGSGDITWGVFRDRSNIRRSDCYVTNVVKCRTIQWNSCPSCGGVGCEVSTEVKGYELTCFNGSIPAIGKTTRDFVNTNPTPAQARECAKRYLYNGELENFSGDTILAMGGTSLSALAGRNLSVSSYEGSVFERGDVVECATCGGSGYIAPVRERKCKACKGGKPVYVDQGVRCEQHPRYKGKAKPRVDCADCSSVYCFHHAIPDCETCSNTRVVTVELKPRKCGHCHGEGSYMRGDNITANVTNHLKDGQLMIATYHPAFIMKDKTKRPAFEATLARVENLHEEKAEMDHDFNMHVYPSPERTESETHRVISADIENPRNGDPWTDRYTMCSVATSPNDVSVYKAGDPRLVEALREAQTVIGQYYLMHDAWWLYLNEGVKPKAIWDTQHAGHLLNPDVPHNLGAMTVEFAEPRMQGYWKARQNYANDQQAVCGIDSIAAWRVRNGQINKLRENGQLDFMENHVVPLCNVLLDIRINGCRIDEERMVEERMRIEGDLARDRALLPFTGSEWGPKVASHLYDFYKLPQVNESDGSRNARKLTLEILADKLGTGEIDIGARSTEALSFVNFILRLRAASKLSSTFFSYPLHNGRVHPALNPAGTATLRLSCKDPNVQQVPKSVRSIFTPDIFSDEWEFTSCDLKQAEIVTFLWLAGEFEMYENILKGLDFHQLTADRMNIDRKTAKVANFAILYNEDPETTAKRNKWSYSTALDLHAAYHRAMPGVRRYQAEVARFSRDNGYVVSPHGVRRYVSLSTNETKGHAYNQAVNAPIQATPAVATRIAMVEAARNLPSDCRVWMQVHDDVIIQHPKELRKEVTQCLLQSLSIGSSMTTHPFLSSAPSLRYVSDPTHGPNWGEMS